MNNPGTGIISFGTKTYLVAPNWDVFTTYPGGWPVGWVGGWVYELKIRLNSASVGVELKLKLKLSLAKIENWKLK